MPCHCTGHYMPYCVFPCEPCTREVVQFIYQGMHLAYKVTCGRVSGHVNRSMSARTNMVGVVGVGEIS